MKSSNINLKFILLNSIAAIMLLLGFRQLVFLLNSKLVEGLLKYNADINRLGKFVFQGSTGSLSDLLTYFFLELSLAGLLAILTSISISWYIAGKENVQKINIIVVIIVCICAAFTIHKFSIDLHDLIPSLLGIFNVVGVKTVLTINSTVLLLFASQLYFNKKLKMHYYQRGT